jgi:Aldehyde dehydrogenase family
LPIGKVAQACILARQTCVQVKSDLLSFIVQVQSHVDDALEKGANAATGGGKPDMQGQYKNGNFFAPTILTDCTIDMQVVSLY